ncbi:hypothetical protein bcere0017_58650 [Bacillus cereus Rock1-3]|nr:hypothetical protein bcere0017_58650 [Bacillus cereus Rock1-3]
MRLRYIIIRKRDLSGFLFSIKNKKAAGWLSRHIPTPHGNSFKSFY